MHAEPASTARPRRPRVPAPIRRAGLARVALLALLALGVAACGIFDGVPPSAAAPGLGALPGTSWQGVRIRDAAPVPDAAPTIRFDGNQAGGTTGCNTYGGTVSVGLDGSVRFDAMSMTEMACPGPRDDQETVVIAILQAANRIAIVDGELRISGPAGEIAFVPAAGG